MQTKVTNYDLLVGVMIVAVVLAIVSVGLAA